MEDQLLGTVFIFEFCFFCVVKAHEFCSFYGVVGAHVWKFSVIHTYSTTTSIPLVADEAKFLVTFYKSWVLAVTYLASSGKLLPSDVWSNFLGWTIRSCFECFSFDHVKSHYRTHFHLFIWYPRFHRTSLIKYRIHFRRRHRRQFSLHTYMILTLKYHLLFLFILNFNIISFDFFTSYIYF